MLSWKTCPIHQFLYVAVPLAAIFSISYAFKAAVTAVPKYMILSWLAEILVSTTVILTGSYKNIENLYDADWDQWRLPVEQKELKILCFIKQVFQSFPKLIHYIIT